MNITQYEPWIGPYEPGFGLKRLHEDVNRLFGNVLHGLEEDGSNILTSRWTPAVDINEENDRFVLSVDIPGVDPKDVELTMENGMLAIRGDRKFEYENKQRNGYRRVERVHGMFYRRFSLPDTADSGKIAAKEKHGVLEITIPKKEVAHPRRIAVKN